MNFSETVWALQTGYCLWVGAGVTRQVAAGHTDVPLWSRITNELESAAGIAAEADEDFPKRLQRCLDALGENAFQGFLRERFYTQLCVALLIQADEQAQGDDLVPQHARQIAALGQLANPIVNFNIEPLSSLLLARSAGPVRILPYLHWDRPSLAWEEPSGRFQRIVYHPHGLATGDSVMTSHQYQAAQQTLAFRLSIHAAFGNKLVIVGMSLNDDYLRHQIETYGRHIKEILWFDSQFSNGSRSWALKNKVTMVEVDWPTFWKHWDQLPIEIERNDLYIAWYRAVQEAAEEVTGGSLGALKRSLASGSTKGTSSNFHRLAEYLAASGLALGETGAAREVRGKDPYAIAVTVQERMLADDIPLPSVRRTFGPRG